jgi:chromosome segregation ATPase
MKLFTVPPPRQEDEEVAGQVEEVPQEEPIRHVDTMTAVARGKRWLIKDDICAAASYFLKKFRDFRISLSKQDELIETQNELIRAQDGIIAEFKANAEVVAKKYETSAKELLRNLHEEKIKHRATTDELNDKLKKSDERFNTLKQSNNEFCKEIEQLKHEMSSVYERLTVAEASLARFTDDKSRMLQLLERSYIDLEQQIRRMGDT